MTVTVNGKAVTLPAGTTVSAYLADHQYQTNRIVVELNEEILSKNRYDVTLLKGGDCVEIVMFVGGGC